MRSEDPDGLGTITSPKHQYVGFVTSSPQILLPLSAVEDVESSSVHTNTLV